MKINFNNIYETYIRIPLPFNHITYINFLRSKVFPLIHELQDKNIIKWFCFLLHLLPKSKDEAAVHIRLELTKDMGIKNLRNILPDFCEYTTKLNGEILLDKIEGINKEILKDSNLEEAWWIIGECSVWIMNMLEAHSDDTDIPIQQVGQFLHYFANIFQIKVR